MIPMGNLPQHPGVSTQGAASEFVGDSHLPIDVPQGEPYSSRPTGRAVAQFGSAPQWGCGGRRFESSRPDHFFSAEVAPKRSAGVGEGIRAIPLRMPGPLWISGVPDPWDTGSPGHWRSTSGADPTWRLCAVLSRRLTLPLRYSAVTWGFSSSPFRTANRMRSAVDVRPSLFITLYLWYSTVLREMPMSAATSLAILPLTIRVTILR